MKKLIFISLFLSSSLAVFGQDTVVVYNNYKYQLGIELSSNESGDLSVSPSTYLVYGFGIQFLRKIKKSKFALSSGFSYCNRAFEINDKLNFNSKYQYGYIYHTLNLPLGIRYENKIFYIGLQGYINYVLNKISTKDRKVNFGFIMAGGIEKNVTKHINIFIEAKDMSNLTPTQIDENSLGLTYLVNYGFSLGASFKIF